MRNTRYGFLVLLSSLLMLTGCSRRDILDDYPVSGVDIKLDWDGVTDQLPEGVRVIFYPRNGDGRKDGSDIILSSFCQSCITGEKAQNVVEEAYCSTVLCLLGNQAMDEQRHIRFPDEYKIPYMKF